MRAHLYRMARRHPIAVAIKQQAGEEAGLVISCARVPLGDVDGKLSLDRVPQRLVDDRAIVGYLPVQSLPRRVMIFAETASSAPLWVSERCSRACIRYPG